MLNISFNRDMQLLWGEKGGERSTQLYKRLYQVSQCSQKKGKREKQDTVGKNIHVTRNGINIRVRLRCVYLLISQHQIEGAKNKVYLSSEQAISMRHHRCLWFYVTSRKQGFSLLVVVGGGRMQVIRICEFISVFTKFFQVILVLFNQIKTPHSN